MRRRLIFLLATALSLVNSLSTCPSMCQCIWRNGKQTALCEKQGLIAIPSGINSATQVLHLNKNNFQVLPSKVFQERGLINLQKVFLGECKLGVIADDAFTQLTNLIELDLGGNFLTDVPSQALNDCPSLRRLMLNNNPIQRLRTGIFASLSQLKSIDLSGSQIDFIEPGAFRGLQRLEFLKLDDNRLTSLSLGVVIDLPLLYSFDLHRNPWNCDCELRAAREWMNRFNVPQSIPPTCASPQRVAGLMWNSLDIDDFACAPNILTTATEVTRYIGSNSTLSCLVKGMPPPKVFWYVDDGFYRNLSSQIMRGEKFFLTEERSEGAVNSMLTITELDESDSQSFICSAENRAGLAMKNFSLNVLPIAFGFVAGWSKAEIAGGIIGFFAVLITLFVLVIIILVRTRRPDAASAKAQDMITVSKDINPVKETIKTSKNHVTIISNDQDQEKRNGSSGYGSGGLTPDLTKHVDVNGFIGNHHSVGQNHHHQTEVRIKYVYNNYQDFYDAEGYGVGLPDVANGQLVNGHLATGQSPAQVGVFYNQSPNISHQVASSSSQPSPANGSLAPNDQRWKRTPIVGAATVVRYSPDEGYAEEVNISHLEGTEV